MSAADAELHILQFRIIKTKKREREREKAALVSVVVLHSSKEFGRSNEAAHYVEVEAFSNLLVNMAQITKIPARLYAKSGDPRCLVQRGMAHSTLNHKIR